MKLTTAIQEAVLCLLCFDESPKGAPFVRGFIPPETFDPFFKDIATEAVQFFDQYGRPPGEQTLDLVQSIVAREPDKEDPITRLYESMLGTKDGLVVDYVLDKAKEFIRYQSAKVGIAAALDALEKDDVNAAEDALRTIEQTRVDVFDPGSFLHDTSRTFRYLDEDLDAFPTGIPELDVRGLGPAPKRLHLFIGPPKGGKSWWLLHLAKNAWMAGKKVLYITLELAEEEVAGRFYQSLFSMTKREGIIETRRFGRNDDEDGYAMDFQTVKVKGRPVIKKNNARFKKWLRGKVSTLTQHRARLLIKEFPSGSLTIKELESYLAGLESVGFLPDLIVLDYADLMKIGVDKKREETGRIFVDLRGIASKRRLAMATASQTNRGGAKSRLRTDTDVAEDYSKIHTADAVLTYNQTMAERKLGLARLFMAAGRTDEDKFQVHISQAYGLGQFCLDSTLMVPGYWDIVDGIEGETEDDDE